MEIQYPVLSADFILLLIFLSATAVQLLFWGLFFRWPARLSAPIPEAELSENTPPFVSVIICARNEAENLQKNLHHFLNQKYRSFEVVVVNDNSTDCTRNVVLDRLAKWSNLRLVEIAQDTPPGKKAALTKGIEAARGNSILLSDADCRPSTDRWIATMQGALDANTILQIGLGFSPYDRQKGFLNLFIRYETAYAAAQYFSSALRGMPYMGVGRNLIYNRSLFERAAGFRRHEHIASGDDDLFVNATATRENTTVILDEKSFVYSLPEKNWSDYYRQKKRHLSTARSYRLLHKALLGALSASHFLHYATAVCMLIAGYFVPLVVASAVLRWALMLLRWNRILRRLHQQDLHPWIILLDVAYIGYYIVLAPALLAGKRNRWK